MFPHPHDRRSRRLLTQSALAQGSSLNLFSTPASALYAIYSLIRTSHHLPPYTNDIPRRVKKDRDALPFWGAWAGSGGGAEDWGFFVSKSSGTFSACWIEGTEHGASVFLGRWWASGSVLPSNGDSRDDDVRDLGLDEGRRNVEAWTSSPAGPEDLYSVTR